jgi:hypothetical protein
MIARRLSATAPRHNPAACRTRTSEIDPVLIVITTRNKEEIPAKAVPYKQIMK